MRNFLIVLFYVGILGTSLYSQPVNPKQILEAPGRDYVLLSTDQLNSTYPIDGIYVPQRLKDSIYVKGDSVCISIIGDGRPDKCIQLPNQLDSLTVININGDTIFIVQDTLKLNTFDFDHESIIFWDDSLPVPFFQEDAADFKWRDTAIYINDAMMELNYLDNIFITNGLTVTGVTGVHNSVLGRWAGRSLSTGSRNAIIGGFAGDAITSGSDNIFIGHSSGGAFVDGIGNIGIGRNAFFSLDTASQNTAIGYLAGQYLTYSEFSTVIGASAGNDVDSLFQSIYIGSGTGQSHRGDYNTFVGTSSGAFGSGNYNTFLGHDAGHNTDGIANIFIGIDAGRDLVVDSIFILDNQENPMDWFLYGDMAVDSLRVGGRLVIRDLPVIDSVQFVLIPDSNNMVRALPADTLNQDLVYNFDGIFDTISISGGTTIYLEDSVRTWDLDNKRVVYWKDGDFRTDADDPYQLGFWYDDDQNAVVFHADTFHFLGANEARITTGGHIAIRPLTGDNVSRLVMTYGPVDYINGGNADTLHWQWRAGQRLDLFPVGRESAAFNDHVLSIDSAGQIDFNDYRAGEYALAPSTWKFLYDPGTVRGLIAFDANGNLVQYPFDSLGVDGDGGGVRDDDWYKFGGIAVPTTINDTMWSGADSSKIVRIGTNQMLSSANVLINGQVVVFETVGNNEAFFGESTAPINYWRQRQAQTEYAWDRVQQDDLWYIAGSNLANFTSGKYLSMTMGYQDFSEAIITLESDGDIRFGGAYDDTRNDPLSAGIPVNNVFYTGPLGQVLVAPLDSLTARQGTPRFYALNDSTLIVTDHFENPLDTVVILGSNNNDNPDTDVDSMKIVQFSSPADDSLYLYEDDVTLAVSLKNYSEQTVRQINDTAFVITWPGTNVGKDTVCFLTNRIYTSNDTLFVNDSIIVFTDYRDSVQTQVFLSGDTLFVFGDTSLLESSDSMGLQVPANYVVLGSGTRAPDTSLLYFDQSLMRLGIGTAAPSRALHIYRDDNTANDFAIVQLEDVATSGNIAAQFRMKANSNNRRIVSTNGDDYTTVQLYLQDDGFYVYTAENGSTTQALRIDSSEQVRFTKYGDDVSPFNTGTPTTLPVFDVNGVIYERTFDELENLIGGPFQDSGAYDNYQGWYVTKNNDISYVEIHGRNETGLARGIEFENGTDISIAFEEVENINGIDFYGVKINHGNTSNLSGEQTSSGQVINSITVDANGHIEDVGYTTVSGGGSDGNGIYSSGGPVPDGRAVFLNGSLIWYLANDSDGTNNNDAFQIRSEYLGSDQAILSISQGSSQPFFQGHGGVDLGEIGHRLTVDDDGDDWLRIYQEGNITPRVRMSGEVIELAGDGTTRAYGSTLDLDATNGTMSLDATGLIDISAGGSVDIATDLGTNDDVRLTGYLVNLQATTRVRVEGIEFQSDKFGNNSVFDDGGASTADSYFQSASTGHLYLNAFGNEGQESENIYLYADNDVIIDPDDFVQINSSAYIGAATADQMFFASVSGQYASIGHEDVYTTNALVFYSGTQDDDVRLVANKTGSSLYFDAHSGVFLVDGNELVTSDSTRKKNIVPMGPVLDELMNVQTVEFDWKRNDRHSVGYIAQNVQEYFPSVVVENDSLLHLNYGGMTAINTAAIQELHEEIKKLKAEIDELRKN